MIQKHEKLTSRDYWFRITGILNLYLPVKQRLTNKEWEIIALLLDSDINKDIWTGSNRLKIQNESATSTVNISVYKRRLQDKGWIMEDGSIASSVKKIWEAANNGKFEFNIILHDQGKITKPIGAL